MELTVTQRRDNQLLDRIEVQFLAAHPASATPTRADLRKAIASTVNLKEGIVILDWARSEFGRSTTRGYAKVYRSKERALALETRPILVRNGLVAAAVKAEPAAPAAGPAPKRESPRERKEAPKPEAKEQPPAKKDEPPAKKEEKAEPKKEAAKKEPAKKEEAPREKKTAAKKEGK